MDNPELEVQLHGEMSTARRWFGDANCSPREAPTFLVSAYIVPTGEGGVRIDGAAIDPWWVSVCSLIRLCWMWLRSLYVLKPNVLSIYTPVLEMSGSG